MKILLSTIGSRGEVQPLLALALALRSLGHEPRLCVPPNFAEWVESFGLACMTTGPDVKKLTGGAAPAISFAKLTPEQRKALAVESVRSQFAGGARLRSRRRRGRAPGRCAIDRRSVSPSVSRRRRTRFGIS